MVWARCAQTSRFFCYLLAKYKLYGYKIKTVLKCTSHFLVADIEGINQAERRHQLLSAEKHALAKRDAK